MSIALYDDFTDPLGEFPNYDTYDTSQRIQLGRQKHIDIRSFEPLATLFAYTMFALDHLRLSAIKGLTMGQLETSDAVSPVYLPFPMSALDLLTMRTLDGVTMLQLEIGTALPAGENWTAGTIGPQADRAHFNGLSLLCTPGVTTTSSVMAPLDLSRFEPTDVISLALPALPLGSLTPSQCFIDFTSESGGNFTIGPTDSLALSTSTTTLVVGDCEARFPLSALTMIDKTRLCAVRLRLTATGSCTFRCLAIRCLSSAWRYGALDQNTLYERLGATVPPSGSLTAPYTFPATPVYEDVAWPILMRSDGASGPAIVDIEVGAVIKTGSNAASNQLTLYFRELPMDIQTMSLLDGLGMSALELLNQQPDYFIGTLDDFSDTHFLSVTLEWGPTASVEIADETSTGHRFSGLSLAAHHHFYLLVSLEDDSLRAQVYPISNIGVIDWSTVVFDSTALIDDSFVRRRRGRFGWNAELGDGDSYVQNIRPRRVVYSEYRSAALRSITPVEGAQLFVSASPDVELYGGAIGEPGTLLSPDVTKSRSGHCFRVLCDGHLPLEGFSTSVMRFENFYDTEVTFDVFAPASAQLTAFLAGEGRFLPLSLPPFPTNRWTRMTLPLELFGATRLPGPYVLFVVQVETAASTWYIDNLSIHTNAVSWAGRGQAADPWRMNDPDWIKFGDALNAPYDGALLARGNALQVRGQVLTPDANIDSLKILPQYSTLGNFTWPDQTPIYGPSPVSAFTTTPTLAPHALFCDATSSTASEGIIDYFWSFGDGRVGYGETITHQYVTPGDYIINLTVIDSLGQKTSLTEAAVVS